MTKIITSLITYLSFYLNKFFTTKNTLYIVKIVADLLICQNKNKIT